MLSPYYPVTTFLVVLSSLRKVIQQTIYGVKPADALFGLAVLAVEAEIEENSRNIEFVKRCSDDYVTRNGMPDSDALSIRASLLSALRDDMVPLATTQHSGWLSHSAEEHKTDLESALTRCDELLGLYSVEA
jgi:hypothetical protein